jgi:predicted nucleic acid-binding protein
VSRYAVILDANVLYPAPIRDILLQLSVADMFRAKWTADIHREWIEALLRNEPHRQRETLERTRQKMDASTRDCLVTNYEPLIGALALPDPDDRHVLAAAIKGRCDAIVTQNLRDFPPDALAPYGIEAQHPDEFLCNQFSLAPGLFCESIRKVRLRLNNPQLIAEQYLANLTRVGLVATAAELEQFQAII